MSEFSPVVLLGAGHDRSQFDCGVEPLNVYLKQYALQNQKKGMILARLAVDLREKAGASARRCSRTPSCARFRLPTLRA